MSSRNPEAQKVHTAQRMTKSEVILLRVRCGPGAGSDRTDGQVQVIRATAKGGERTDVVSHLMHLSPFAP